MRPRLQPMPHLLPRWWWLLTLLLPSIVGAQTGLLIAPNDVALRSDLQRLNDASAISIPVGSWPLSRSDLNRALLQATPTTQGDTQLIEQLQRRFNLTEKIDPRRFSMGINATSSSPSILLNPFGEPQRAEQSIHLGWQQRIGPVELGLALQLNSSETEDQLTFDNTTLTLPWGNWLLTAGTQQRWWGPGWEGSLLLSTNARPVPTLSIQRQHSLPFESALLRWIGPWNLTTFIGELDDERTITGAKLFGMRIAFMPHPSLEIGLERTAMLGGAGRPEGLSTYWNMFIGKDNGFGVMDGREVGNISQEDEPGNQIAGLSLRWRLPAAIPLAYYYQRMSEDATINPKEWGALFDLHGLEYWGHGERLRWRLHFEYADTMSESISPNIIYEHHIYRSGYRYHGQAIGHNIDNDSLMRSLGLLLQHQHGQQWQLTLSQAHLNQDGGNRSALIPNSRSSTAALMKQITLAYRSSYQGILFDARLHQIDIEPVDNSATIQKSVIQLAIERKF